MGRVGLCVAQHDQALADAARVSAESAITAHVRVRAEEAATTAAHIERLEKDKASAQLQMEQLSEQLRTEKANNARSNAGLADTQSSMQQQKDIAEARVPLVELNIGS